MKGYKARLYPTPSQAVYLRQMFGSTRFVYNHFLAERIRVYGEEKKTLTYSQTTRLLTELKNTKEYSWLKDCDSIALQQSLRDLDTAYANFFKNRTRFPRFHSRHGKQSYRTYNIRLDGNKVRLPKIGFIKSKGLKPFTGHIINATVSMSRTGKYYVSLCVAEEDTVKPNRGGVIGIDVGIKSFYTDSNGNTVANPGFYRKYEKKIAREHRRLSRKKKGSNNRNKQRLRLARAYEKMANTRSDFLHKQTRFLASENQVACVEDLNVAGMLKNRRLAKHISDASWPEFTRQLDYKTREHGGILVKIPTFYPSSQTCSSCGYKNPLVKNLAIRTWECPDCGSTHDRDTNAAQNIVREGLKILDSTVGHTGTGELSSRNACGDYIRPNPGLAPVSKARIPRL